jgi:hypothetical protein
VVISHLCDVDDRMANPMRKRFPKAHFFTIGEKCLRKSIRALLLLLVAIPDHNRVIVGLKRCNWVSICILQNHCSHDIHEVRVLTEASKKYKIVAQMGDQGASSEGLQTLREWIEAGILGDIEKVYCWTKPPRLASGYCLA